MSAPFPSATLGDVLRQDTAYVHDLEPREYPKLSVKLYGRGVVLDTPTHGSFVKMQKHQLACSGQVILSEIWAKKGAIGIVPPEGDGALCTSHFFLFDIDESRVVPSFIAWLLRGNFVEPQLNSEARGTTGYAAIRPKQFLATSIPLPPLDEQRRIVARIEALTAKTEEAKALRREAQRETDASLAGAVDMHFTPSSDWRMSTVGQLCEKPQYGFSAPSTRDPVGPRLLRITDIQGGCVDWNTVPYCECSNPDTYLLREGDLVFARTGGTTGKSFIIRDCPDAIFASYLIRLRPTSAVSVEYLYWFFQSRRYWQQIQDGVRGTGQPNLNGTKLAALSIPLAPLKRQREIVTKLDALQAKMNAAKALQAETADELEAMLPAILDKAFKGNL